MLSTRALVKTARKCLLEDAAWRMRTRFVEYFPRNIQSSGTPLDKATYTSMLGTVPCSSSLPLFALSSMLSSPVNPTV